MMSILISGASMPKSCLNCDWYDSGNNRCELEKKSLKFIPSDDNGLRPIWCPISEVPDNHGRLIDADVLMKQCQLTKEQAEKHGQQFADSFYSNSNDISTEWWCVEDMIENAPTIIDKEGSD